MRAKEKDYNLGCSPSGALRDMPRGLDPAPLSKLWKAAPAGITVTECWAAAALWASFMVLWGMRGRRLYDHLCKHHVI